jgi:hypothetical protein
MGAPTPRATMSSTSRVPEGLPRPEWREPTSTGPRRFRVRHECLLLGHPPPCRSAASSDQRRLQVCAARHDPRALPTGSDPWVRPRRPDSRVRTCRRFVLERSCRSNRAPGQRADAHPRHRQGLRKLGQLAPPIRRSGFVIPETRGSLRRRSSRGICSTEAGCFPLSPAERSGKPALSTLVTSPGREPVIRDERHFRVSSAPEGTF